MAGPEFARFRASASATVDGHGATRMEHAARWRVNRAGHFALHGTEHTVLFHQRIGYRYGGEQRLSVGMLRIVEQFVGVGEFHDSAEIHHRHALA